MAKNLQIANALNHADLLSRGELAERTNALSALVAAGNRLADFRQALLAHRTFWIKFDDLANSNFTEGDEFLTAEGTDEEHDGLEILLQLAAEKRVILGLQSANEEILKKLIAPNNEQAVREALVADPVATQIGKVHEALGWGVDDENFLTNAATIRIQQEAQRLLLASKINACTAADIVKVENLLTAITNANNVNFVLAAKALNVDDTSAAKMAHDVLDHLVKAEAAKKTFLATVAKIYTNKYALEGAGGKLNPYTQLNMPHNEFVAALPVPYNYISEDDAESIKAALGSQYLSAKIDGLDSQSALKVAKSTDLGHMRAALKGDQADEFLTGAVQDNNLANLRHLAAVRALKLAVENSYDMTGLTALNLVRNVPAFNTALETSPSLGFDGEAGKELRNAFKKDNTAFIALIPVAHVRISMLEASNQEDLKVLYTATALTNDDFATKFLEKFPNPVKPEYLKPYFLNNRVMIQQQALLAGAKLKFLELEADALAEILAANTDGELRDAIKVLLGINDDSIDHLIENSNVEQINKELRAYAQIELVVKSASGKDFDELLDIINKLQENVLVKDILDVSTVMTAQIELMSVLLAKCPAEKLNHLVKLTQAKNLFEMKAALEELGIKDLNWLSEQGMQDLKNAALPHAIELKIDASSAIGIAARPELLKLFKTFSPENQQALLANDKLIPAVMNATSSAKFAKMLDIPDSLIAAGTALRDEYDRIILSSKIQNAAIAKTLAGMPFVVLTDDIVDKINAILIEPTLDLDRNTFIETIQKITTVVSPLDLVLFNRGFGLDALGALYQDNYVAADLIIAQYKYNEYVMAALRGPDSPEKDIYKFIAALNKSGSLSIANGQNLVVACKDATSRIKLIEKIKAIDPAIDADTLKSFEQKLTHDIYNDLKRPFSQAKFIDNTTRQATIDADMQAASDKLTQVEKLTDVDSGMRRELERLSNLSAMAWLNPAFQSAAHKNAYSMKQHFTELNDACNVIVTNLEAKQAFFQEKLASLPSPEEVKASRLLAQEQRSIEDHRVFLTDKKKDITKDLSLYTKVQTVLQGNPNNPSDSLTGKGVLKMLDEAMAGRPVKFLGYESKCVAYNKSEREAHFRPGYTGVKADPKPMEMVLGANTKSYEVDPDNMKLGKDEFFEHTIGSGADEGYFTEEHGPRHQAPHYNPGKGTGAEAVDFPVEVKLSPNKFPASEDARIQYSMAMASRMLAGATPSLENKILIQCTDKEKARHMWTACMAQMMAMGISAGNAQKFITVRCPFFDPSQEMGTLYGLSGDSLYETKYRPNSIVTSQNADIQELTKDLADAEKGKKEVVSDVKVVNEKFKEAKSVIQEMKDKNAEQDDDTPTIRMR